MAFFKLHRDYRLISAIGHTVQFLKDEPTYVPPPLHKAVQEIGAVLVEGDAAPILEDEQDKRPELSIEERHRQLLDAFKLLQDRNARGDFTGQGIPSMTALKKIISDFDPDKAEVENLWHQYLDELNG